MRLALLGAPGTGKRSLAQALADLPPSQYPSGLVRIQVLGDALPPEDGPNTLLVDPQPPLQWAAWNALHRPQHHPQPPRGDINLRYDLYLLMGMDLGNLAKGDTAAQYDPTLPAQLDAHLRQRLQQQGLPFALVYGRGPERLKNALQAISGALNPCPVGDRKSNWCWNCENCSDAACEHQLFSRHLGGRDTSGTFSAAPHPPHLAALAR